MSSSESVRYFNLLKILKLFNLLKLFRLTILLNAHNKSIKVNNVKNDEFIIKENAIIKIVNLRYRPNLNGTYGQIKKYDVITDDEYLNIRKRLD